MKNDELIFAPETLEETLSLLNPWRILIVDDDRDIHTVTKLALDEVVINDRSLESLSCYSAAEAKELLKKDQEFALIFLDIVMEHDRAGLDVVDFIRKELNNHTMRIIIRTGEAGSAPERMIIDNYDINDYKEKTELNAQRLYTTVRSSLLQYEQLTTLYQYQHDLQESIDQKVQEIQMQENALIESSKHAQMGDFLNMISHQWRQPLGRIGAVISQMKIGRSLESLSSEEMDEMLDSAELHVQHLSKIIRDFQDLYRVKEKKEYISVSKMLKNSLNILHDSLDASGIKIIVDDSAISTMPKLRSEMSQVFLNIIKNAFDAIINHEQKEGIIQISLSQNSNHLRVDIEDNAGFDKDNKLTDKIFEPYISSDEDLNGKGLGLHICKVIVEKHCNGSLTVERGEDGACFTIVLPIESKCY